MDNLNNIFDEPDEDILYSDDEEGDQIVVRLPKRYIRDGQNPFDFFSDVEFKKRYRFSKDAVMNGILPLIHEPLTKNNNRGLPISPVFQLITSLRFYATASFQLVCADLLSISQSSVSRIVFRVSALLAAQMRDYIKMPSTREDQAENRRLFKQLGMDGDGIGLPGIDGAIDCTHIRITHTKFLQFQETYRNRKGWFSLNVQAVVGPRMEILDIVPEWPGSEHDSRIFQNSRIYMRYRERLLSGVLVGDAGYPSLPFLLTPVANPISVAEERYNYIQSRTRCVVERLFGVWKRRFPCLSRGMANKLICVTTIIVACAVLHNMSLTIDEILPEDDELHEEHERIPQIPAPIRPGEGTAMRRALIERLFHAL